MEKMKNVNRANLETFANCVKATINSMNCNTEGESGKCVYSITQTNGVITYTKTDNIAKWTTPRTFTFSGDVTGTLSSIDGSTNKECVITITDNSHNHILSNITDITASATELNYCDGVTSSIQTQLNAKAPTNHATTSSAYGLATGGLYGHVTLCDGDVATVVSADGLAAGMGHSHSNYVLINGDTMTGLLTLADDFNDDNPQSCALNLANSNISYVNAIYFADTSDAACGYEGINFASNTANTSHTLLIDASGTFRVAVNRQHAFENVSTSTTKTLTLTVNSAGVLNTRSITTSASSSSAVTASISSAGVGQFTGLRVGGSGSNIVSFYKSNGIIYIN